MPDQDISPTSAEEANEVEQSLSSGKILRTLIWVVPLIIIIVIISIVLLALIGPAVGHVYTTFDSL